MKTRHGSCCVVCGRPCLSWQRFVFALSFGLLIGMAGPALGQSTFAGKPCSEFSELSEMSRDWYVLGAVDTVNVLGDAKLAYAPTLEQRYVGLPMGAFLGAVHAKCLSQPCERVGRASFLD
jgi:hypothetical protein